MAPDVRTGRGWSMTRHQSGVQSSRARRAVHASRFARAGNRLIPRRASFRHAVHRQFARRRSSRRRTRRDRTCHHLEHDESALRHREEEGQTRRFSPSGHRLRRPPGNTPRAARNMTAQQAHIPYFISVWPDLPCSCRHPCLQSPLFSPRPQPTSDTGTSPEFFTSTAVPARRPVAGYRRAPANPPLPFRLHHLDVGGQRLLM